MAFALRKHDSEFDSQPIADINVTPLVDVMLVLLIIFMVTAPLIQQGVELNLPDARAKAVEATEQKLVLSIKADRSIWLGTSDDPQLILAPGRYRVELVNTHYNYRSTLTVDVPPGRITSRTVSLPMGSVRVNTEAGAEVWIEGERAGVAPIEAVDVPIGTREVVVRHPDLGERREAVEVRYGETAQVSVSLQGRDLPANAFPLPPGQRLR